MKNVLKSIAYWVSVFIPGLVVSVGIILALRADSTSNYDAGYRSGKSGGSPEACPHLVGMYRQAWMAGFEDGRKDK